MSPDIKKLRDELAKSNNHETSYFRGCIADLIKDKADRNLLNICLNAGVLQDFFQDSTRDTFFIQRCKKKLIEEFFVSETGADRAIFFCKFLLSEETELQLIPYRKDNKWGFCTSDKYIVIDCIYNRAEPFINGLGEVRFDNEWFNIDFNGSTKKIEHYYVKHRLSEGLMMDEKNGKLGFIDINGSLIIPHKYDCHFGETFKYSEGLAGVRIGNKLGFIDQSDRIILPFIYEDWLDVIEVYPCFDEGIVHVQIDSKWGFIDRWGVIVIPFIYDSFYDSFTGKVFSNGLGYMKKNDKWGFIDRQGNMVIPFIYDDAWSAFSEGLARVKKDNKYGFIDQVGNEIIPFIYDDTLFFSEGLAGVKKDNKYGFIDKNGEVVIPIIYAQVQSFSNRLAYVRLNEKQMGYVDLKGIQFWED